jgi:hypothetical protein
LAAPGHAFADAASASSVAVAASLASGWHARQAQGRDQAVHQLGALIGGKNAGWTLSPCANPLFRILDAGQSARYHILSCTITFTQDTMTNLLAIEKVGPVNAEKLQNAGIGSIEALLLPHALIY